MSGAEKNRGSVQVQVRTDGRVGNRPSQGGTDSVADLGHRCRAIPISQVVNDGIANQSGLKTCFRHDGPPCSIVASIDVQTSSVNIYSDVHGQSCSYLAGSS